MCCSGGAMHADAEGSLVSETGDAAKGSWEDYAI